MLELLKSKHLQQIGISELCTYAGVSRSTFYTYYSNVEDIYRSLVKDLILGTRTLKIQLKYSENETSVPYRPFCETIRDESYKGLIKEDRFIHTFIDMQYELLEDDTPGIYLDVVNDPSVAKMIYVFQITGCLAAAKIGKDDPEWAATRKAIDTFIQGGLDALRAHYMR